jgi:hypothetical protein
MVGLLPLCAATVVKRSQREAAPRLVEQIWERIKRMPELLAAIHATGPANFGVAERGIIGLVNEDRLRLRRILIRMLDENEFLSPYGIRSLSRYHAEHPYVFSVGGHEYRVVICLPSRTQACSAAIRTGAGPSGCRSTL